VAEWRQVNDIGNDVPPARPARQASGSTWDTWSCRRLSPFGQFGEREAAFDGGHPQSLPDRFALERPRAGMDLSAFEVSAISSTSTPPLVPAARDAAAAGA
jgi:hypothetical protein